mgnify:CR=1 FL=1
MFAAGVRAHYVASQVAARLMVPRRRGGPLLLDLYHPDWLAANGQAGTSKARGALIDRWLEDGRSCHEIR